MENERKDEVIGFEDLVNRNIDEVVDRVDPAGDEVDVERLFADMTRVDVDNTPEPPPLEPGAGANAILLGQGLYLTEEDAKAADPPPYQAEDPEPLDFLKGPEDEEEVDEPFAKQTEPKSKPLVAKEEVGDLTAYVFGSYEPDRDDKPSESETIARWVEGAITPDERVDFNLPFEDAPYGNVAMFQALCCRRVVDVAEAKARNALARQCDAFSSVVGDAGRSTIVKMTSLEKIGDPSNVDQFRNRAKVDRESQKASKSLVERFVVPDGPSRAWARKSIDLEPEYRSLAKQIDDAQVKAANNLETYAKMFEAVGRTDYSKAIRQMDVGAFAGIVNGCNATQGGSSESMEVAVLMATAMSYMTNMVGASSAALKQSDQAFAALMSRCESTVRSSLRTTCWILNNHEQDLKNEEARLSAEMIKLDERVDASCPSSTACASLTALASACNGVASWIAGVTSLLEQRTRGLATKEETEILRDLNDVRSALLASATTSTKLSEVRPATSIEANATVWSSRSAARRCVDAFSYLANAYEKARSETRSLLLTPLFASSKARIPSNKDRLESDREDASELPTQDQISKKINELIELRSRLVVRRTMLSDERRRIENAPANYEQSVYERESEQMSAELDSKDKVLAKKYVDLAFASKWLEGRAGPIRRADNAVDSAKETMDRCKTAENAAVEAREASLLYAKRRCMRSTEEKHKIASSALVEARVAANSSLEEYARNVDRIDAEFAQNYSAARTSYYQCMQRVAILDSAGFRSLNELLEVYARMLRKVYEDVSLRRSVAIRESCKKTLACADCVSCEANPKKK